jgi:hypothetical protein
MQATDTGARDLIRHVLGEVDAYLVTWTRAPGSPPGEGADQRYWKYPEQLGDAVAHLHAESDRGRDAYFAVSPFKESGNRKNKNVMDTV